jgi:patatin-like phospholipase/acyl hydrolase
MNVLALQGGGVLGYGQSLILSQLEASASLSSSCMFDMIGGTSVGSIIGAPLSIGISANKIEQFFTQDAGVIFSSNVFSTIGSAFGPKYSATQLEESLKSMLGVCNFKRL